MLFFMMSHTFMAENPPDRNLIPSLPHPVCSCTVIALSACFHVFGLTCSCFSLRRGDDNRLFKSRWQRFLQQNPISSRTSKTQNDTFYTIAVLFFSFSDIWCCLPHEYMTWLSILCRRGYHFFPLPHTGWPSCFAAFVFAANISLSANKGHTIVCFMEWKSKE